MPGAYAVFPEEVIDHVPGNTGSSARANFVLISFEK
jgi:hypothetical protein